MTEIPEDIRKKADTVALAFNSLAQECLILDKPPKESVRFGTNAIAQALLDERERCAKIAASHYNTTHSHQARFAGANIASAIRSQASPSKPAQGTPA